MYQKTMEKNKIIIDVGYNLVEIWHHEFKPKDGKVKIDDNLILSSSESNTTSNIKFADKIKYVSNHRNNTLIRNVKNKKFIERLEEQKKKICRCY
jgi:hypothetical protein